jgi:hypothetical protein
MPQTPEEILARLDPPGAGIAFYYRWVATWLTRPMVANRTSWDTCRRRCIKYVGAFRREVTGLDEAALATRVLVPRLFGLEDSSRYWSVAMTVRHVSIVSQLISSLIVRLSQGEKIDTPVSIAAVKPEVTSRPAETLAEYLAFADRMLDDLDARSGDRRSTATHIHPWFGPLSTRGWFWLLGTHTWVHLRQVRQIRRGLSSAGQDAGDVH